MPKRRPKTMPAATARTVSSGMERGELIGGIVTGEGDGSQVTGHRWRSCDCTCHPSPVTRHPSPVTRHLAYPAPMSHNLRRDLGVVESYAALLGILIGAGIFKATGVAWELAGPSVVLGYLVLAPAILAASVAYAVFVSTPLGKEPGGEYAHISRTFGGHGLAFVGAWLKVISYIGALAYLSRAFGDYVNQLFGGGDVMLIAVGCLIFFYAIHVAGVRWFGRLQVWMCIVLGVSLVVLVVPGLFAVRMANYHPFFPGGIKGFANALPPLFFAYAGFESLAQTAGEVKDSTSRLPRVFLHGIVATMTIYLLMSAVALGVLPAAKLRVSEAPMADAAA